MGLLCTEAVFIFLVGYLRLISSNKTDSIDCSVCGIGLPEPSSRFLVRHGKAVSDSRILPWMVSLRGNPDFNYCGGAILDEYFILTAAHCAEGLLEMYNEQKVYFQTNSSRRLSKGFAIDKFIIHPKYKLEYPETGKQILFAHYDIALLKLKKKIKCDAYKRPICLPTPDLKIPTGSTNIVAGWGSPLAGEKGQTKELHYCILKHLDFEKCTKPMPDYEKLRDHMLCAGGSKQSVCYGDSGSPLMDKINSKYTVVGITSSETESTCNPSFPNIFTNVAKFVKWIKKQQKKF